MSCTEGKLTFQSNGSYEFNPATNFTGAVPEITYTISDGKGNISSRVLNIKVFPDIDTTLSIRDFNITSVNVPLKVSAINGLLAKTTDLDQNDLLLKKFEINGKIYFANTGDFRRFLINAFTFFEFFFLALFLWINLVSTKAKLALVLLSSFFFLFLIYFYISSHFSRIDSIPIGIESIIIISFSFYFFYEKIKNPSVGYIYSDYRFWILIGMIVYLAGSFFIYIYGEQLEASEWKKIKHLPLLFYIIRALFFSIAIIAFINTPEEKPKLSSKKIPFLDIT